MKNTMEISHTSLQVTCTWLILLFLGIGARNILHHNVIVVAGVIILAAVGKQRWERSLESSGMANNGMSQNEVSFFPP